MNRNFGYIFAIITITLFSCTQEKKPHQNQGGELIEHSEQETLLDPEFETYRVVMAGYDTTTFSQHYKERIEPPTINLNQSIDKQSISELYILKNTLLAMKGKVFEDAVLYAYFQNIAWYQPPFWDQDFEINLNSEEEYFINRIERKINELQKENLLQNQIPNPVNVINKFQYENLPHTAWDKIAKNGFIILDEPYHQPTSQYIESWQNNLPPIITTDMVLHQLHLFYGSLENEIEAVYLTDILKRMLEIINVELYSSYEKTLDSAIEKAIEESLLYYSIPYAVITGNKTNLIGNYNQIYFDELTKVLQGEGIGSKVIKNDNFNYEIFKPYSHYTKNDKIEKYYKAITWLQKINLCLSDEEEFRRAILIAYIINNSPDLKNSYDEYIALKTYFSSQKEQFTFWDLADVINQVEGIKLFEDLYKKETVIQIKEILRLKDAGTCQMRVSLMPVEYQNLYTDLSLSVKDDENPSPVKLFAALRNQAALDLTDSQENAAVIMDNLLNISKQEDAKSLDWLSTLLTSLDEDKEMPPAMTHKSWKMKTLNAAMASWVQLNERVNIQVKKNTPEKKNTKNETVLKGYVEPNIAFYNASLTLLQNTKSFFEDRYMLSNGSSANIEKLLGLIDFLKSMSQKQLVRQNITSEEFNQIALIGFNFQDLAFAYLNMNHRSEIHEISNSMAFATAVFHGGKNKNHISGIGPSHTILVPVEIDGFIYLTRGSVYCYYEINDFPRANILQNEWNNMLQEPEKYSISPWLKDYYFNIATSEDGVVARK